MSYERSAAPIFADRLLEILKSPYLARKREDVVFQGMPNSFYARPVFRVNRSLQMQRSCRVVTRWPVFGGGRVWECLDRQATLGDSSLGAPPFST
jgi:hypothetical protein